MCSCMHALRRQGTMLRHLRRSWRHQAARSLCLRHMQQQWIPWVPLLHCTDSSAYASKAHTKAGRRGLHLRAVGTCHIGPEALARQIPVITAQSSSLGNVVCKLLAGSAGWSCQDRLAGGGDQASHLSPSSQVVKDLQQNIIYLPQYGPLCIAWLVHDPDLSAQHLLSRTMLEDKQF